MKGTEDKKENEGTGESLFPTKGVTPEQIEEFETGVYLEFEEQAYYYATN